MLLYLSSRRLAVFPNLFTGYYHSSLITPDSVVSGNADLLNSPLLGEAPQRVVVLQGHVLRSCKSCITLRAYMHSTAASFSYSKMSGGLNTFQLGLHSRGIATQGNNYSSTSCLYTTLPPNSFFFYPTVYQISPSLGNWNLLVFYFSQLKRLILHFFLKRKVREILYECFPSYEILRPTLL